MRFSNRPRFVAYSRNFNYWNSDEDRFEYEQTQAHRRVVQEIYRDLFGKDGLRWHDWFKGLMIKFFSDRFATRMHRLFSPHHENYRLWDNLAYGEKNWDGKPIRNIVEACIDWQSARFTKSDKPLDAYQTWKKYYRHADQPEVSMLYAEALKDLQRLAASKGLLSKWGTWWDFSDPETNV